MYLHTNENGPLIKWFRSLTQADIPLAGRKNVLVGDMFYALTNKGINIPNGFAITSIAYRNFIHSNLIYNTLSNLMASLDKKDFTNLEEISKKGRNFIRNSAMPVEIEKEILENYWCLCKIYGHETDVAIFSSATTEDFHVSSFAGKHESYLSIRGGDMVINAVKDCISLLFTEKAIQYREDNGIDHMDATLSVGIQKMVRSDIGSSGVAFTLDPESGFTNIVFITGVWGLDENIVHGKVFPDEFYVFKPGLKGGNNGVINKKLGTKAKTLLYAGLAVPGQVMTTLNTDTPIEKMESYVLADAEINQLAKWSVMIEKHYGRPMHIEWAKDGITGELFIVHAHPETIRAKDKSPTHAAYILKEKDRIHATGNAMGRKISSGLARITSSPAEADAVKEELLLVAW